MRRLAAVALTGTLILGLLAASGSATPAAARSSKAGAAGGDVTVVAVLDYGLNPYHWDFLASKMPQALDRDPSNDLPLDSAPDRWLRGFPSPKAFDSMTALNLTLEEKDKDAPIPGNPDGDNMDIDADEWEKVKGSSDGKINYAWIPGTKVIGAVDFAPGDRLFGDTISHGVGTTSVSVGNIHGTCPECLLVFVDIGPSTETAEAAFKWATSQPWIDVITNSYGHGDAKIYNGTTVENQKLASDRGQTVFFSGGNGSENLMTVPNPTYMSSQKGPDWLITVGGVNPGEDNYYDNPFHGQAEHASYWGAGKPVDVAGIAFDYPAAYHAETVGGTGGAFIQPVFGSGFSGTSNAAPTVAGHYARALYLSRLALDGPSRVQKGDVIATGGGFQCAETRQDCELRDGKLTASELRTRLLHGAIHTPAGMTTFFHGAHTPPIGEEEFMNEGHGTYFARESGKKTDWLKEFERIIGPILGRAETLKRPEGEREWMVVDSFCRQTIWGSWRGGYYLEDNTRLPGPDPAYPVRSMLEQSCPSMTPPP